MKKIKNFKEEVFDKSNFIIPKRVSFELNQTKITWDYIKVHDCVSVIMYHKDKKSLVFVKQFRPALYMHQINDELNTKKDELGYTLELCSGIVDKNLSYEQIAFEECVEETGYKPKKLEFIDEFYNGLGSGVSKQRLYYTEVCEDDRVGSGGGVDGEDIELVFIGIDDYKNTMNKHIKTPLSEFAFLWFLENKYETK